MFVRLQAWAKMIRLLGLGVVLLAAGCAAQKPQEQIRPVWPPPPQTARIEFVRSIASDADVGHDTTFTQSVVNFLAGFKPPATKIWEPMGLVASDDGQILYVSDYGQGAVFIFDFGKKNFSKLGPLQSPAGIALDANQNLYVVEQRKRGITVFNPDGKTAEFITDPSVERPTGIAVDRERKRIYLADTAHSASKEHTVKIFSFDGKLIGKVGKDKGNAPGSLLFPTYVALDREGNLYVTDSLNCRVQKFSPDGKYLQSFGQRGDAWGEFTRPKGVALDSFGNVYVVDTGWSNVQIFNQKGQVLLFFGGRGPAPGMLKNPTSLAIGRDDHIYVGDYINNRVEEYRLVNTTAADSVPAAGTPPAGQAFTGQ